MAPVVELMTCRLSLSSIPHGTSPTTIPHALSSSSAHLHLGRCSCSSSSFRTIRAPILLLRRPFRALYRFSSSDDDDHEGRDEDGFAGSESFDGAVALFNRREYYKCHDFLEALWNGAEEPRRTLFHGILQCAVGFHHLFNQNHKGAMMELGEGLCKLRKMNFERGPFYQFEQEISAALDFIYQTQIELAACAEDLCIAMDRSEKSYQLLGGYAAGQNLYRLQEETSEDAAYIVFSPERTRNGELLRVKLPTLSANEEHLHSL
ncbi:hypothetical protein SAY87_009995 [Trapa incisa]|uniref:DUF309 domain-containing protein n=1 Tax=Trapa incisa TaxID=236973 RepID=A0AAN7GGI1_9MYRT|nr:hypothetical protein SAY87_009995 [Trapa incisa]